VVVVVVVVVMGNARRDEEDQTKFVSFEYLAAGGLAPAFSPEPLA
jgi:hypothetical protein